MIDHDDVTIVTKDIDFTIEEFEKIKSEIEKLAYRDAMCNLVLPAWQVYDLIDRHIEDLNEKYKYKV